MGPELAWASDLTPWMLLDGFQVLGRMLDTVETIARDGGSGGLTTMLVEDRWGLPGGRAEELAEQVLRFWDEHVSVFKLTRVGRDVQPKPGLHRGRDGYVDEVMRRRLLSRSGQYAPGLQGLRWSPWARTGTQPRPGSDAARAWATMTPMRRLAVGTVVWNGTIALDETDLRRLVAQLLQHIAAIDAGELALSPRKSGRRASLPRCSQAHRRTDSWPLVEELCRTSSAHGPADSTPRVHLERYRCQSR